jgi:hypothetical protein
MGPLAQHAYLGAAPTLPITTFALTESSRVGFFLEVAVTSARLTAALSVTVIRNVIEVLCP